MTDIETIESRRKRLKDQDWPDLLKRLELFTIAFQRFYSKTPGAHLHQPMDWIKESILSYLDGSRSYNPNKCSFFKFLCGTIRSKMDNHHRKSKANNVVSLSDSKVQPFQADTTSEIDRTNSRKELLKILKDKDSSGRAHNVVGAILYWDKVTEAELGEYLNLTRGEVRQAKEKVKEILLEKIQEDYLENSCIKSTISKREVNSDEK